MKINEILNDGETENLDNFFILKMFDIYFHHPLNVQFKCICCGRCCITNDIALSSGDMERIKQFLTQHKKLYPFRNNFFDIKEKNALSPKGFFLKKVPLLRPLKIGNKTFNSKCIFLSLENKCRIHEVKPNLCIEYPYSCLPIFDELGIYHFGFVFEGVEESGTHKAIFNIEKYTGTMNYLCNGFMKGTPNIEELKDKLLFFERSIKELSQDADSEEFFNKITDISQKIKQRICPIHNTSLTEDYFCNACNLCYCLKCLPLNIQKIYGKELVGENVLIE